MAYLVRLAIFYFSKSNSKKEFFQVSEKRKKIADTDGIPRRVVRWR
jgi:hypothetical protein